MHLEADRKLVIEPKESTAIYSGLIYLCRLFAIALLYLAIFTSIFSLFIILGFRSLTPGLNQNKPRAREIVSAYLRLFRRTIAALGFAKTEIQGMENLQKEPPVVIIANHPGLIDALLILSYFPNIACLGKSHLGKNYIMNFLFSSLGYVYNSSNEDIIENCAKIVEQGTNLLLFPEGTRSEFNKVGVFSRSPALIALKANSPIVPVIIKYSSPLLDKSCAWHGAARQCVNINIKIYPNFTASRPPEDFENQRDASIALTAELQQFFERHFYF